jgi:hypothetical protein
MTITLTLTLPGSLSLIRLCRMLRAAGLRLSYGGDGAYHVSERADD